MPRSTQRYPMSSRQNFTFALSFLFIATTVEIVVANVNFQQAMTGLSLLQNSGLETADLNRHRKDQTDPCNVLLEDANACLLSANPTCGACVATAFDMFLSTTTANFTCADFRGGVCPILFQQCLCTPCNTELESYFSCVLNDVSDNECPVAYCDPLKDFSITPEACIDDLVFATSCIGSECLQCLGETIDSGAACETYEETVCNAVNIDCLSCLQCRNVVEPWLRCIAVESKSCATFQCDAIVSPAAPNAPTIIPPAAPTITPPSFMSNETTSLPTSSPMILVVDTPTVAPVTVSSPTIVVPSMDSPAPAPPTATTKDVPTTSMAVRTALSSLCYITIIGIWLSYLL